MADENTEGGGKRRRPPTIDLKATEVASEPVQPSEPTEKSAEMAAAAAQPDAAAAAESPAAQPSAEASSSANSDWLGTAPWNERLSSMRRDFSRAFDWRLLGAGAAGAVATAALFLVAYASGMFTPPDTAAPLAAQIGSLEKQVRELAARPQSAPADPRPVADLTARVAAVEQIIGKVEAAKEVPRPDQLDLALGPRVAALETSSHALMEEAGRAGAGISRAISAARDAKARADAAYEAAQKSPPAGASQKEIGDLTARVAALEQATKTAEARITTNAGADQASRLAFTADALRGAVARGEPYARELGAVRPLLPDAKVLAPLETFAATGLPSAAALSRELSQLSPTMLAAAGTPARDTSLLGRLQSTGLIKVRPLNEAPGNDPTTVLGRADVKASRGDLAGARAEVASLPAAVQAPAQSWIARVDARDAALAAARKLAENAIGTLGKP